jgi:hypothetical protein
VRLALYFERKASGIKTAYNVLADKALLQVVETAFDLPTSLSLLDIDKQAAIIGKRLNTDDFQDPVKLKKFLTSFAAKWEIANPSSTAQVPTLQINQPIEASISVDLLTNLQKLKLGGV